MKRTGIATEACPTCPSGVKDARARQCRACFRSSALSEEQVQFLRENIDGMTWAQLANALGRHRAAIRATAQRYGIKRAPWAATQLMQDGKTGGATPTERFWQSVEKSEGCWLWTGPRDPHGYGIMRVKRRHVRAHRFSYELHNGPIADGLSVCHHCDNPPCINPAHLFAGTQRDNTLDALAKGRCPIGVEHHQSKLTPTTVRAIRERIARGAMQRDVAREFGVTQPTISLVVRGRTWRHVA